MAERIQSRGAIYVTDEDIRERIAEYKLALKQETQASVGTRWLWQRLVAMLEELLERREAEKKGTNG